ncbi:hypothetical protein D3C72_1887690 [compost metagenome]
MEATQFAELRQARDDHFNVRVRRMVAQVDQAFGFRPQRAGAGKAGAPVGDRGGIEGRLEQLVFNK